MVRYAFFEIVNNPGEYSDGMGNKQFVLNIPTIFGNGFVRISV